jgi:PPM family protein phosphatase
MKIEVWAKTDVGLKRESNEDSILIDRDLKLYCVADGMGGHAGGEVASKLAVTTAQEMFKKVLLLEEELSPRDFISQVFQEASQRIYHKSHMEKPELLGMGTTMVLAFIHAGRIFFGNVGDSRAYLFRQNKLWQISEDHSYVNEQIKAGALVDERDKDILGKNVITRSVGFERDVSADTFERVLEAGESYLLCSDGLCGLVSDDRISEIFAQSTAAEVVPKCIEEAKKNGGDDNISAIVIKVS